MSEYEVKLSRRFKASSESLFNAWVQPEMIKKFMMPMPGTSIAEANVNAVEGGDYRIVMAVGDKMIPVTGKYLNVEPHQRLRFSWFSPNAPETSVVELLFNAVNDQETEMILHHTNFETAEQASDHNKGWNLIVENLENCVV